jgi:phospholipid/cholesterol/gamma-HCH transport system substrate-binding protein/paraquat-inducible protein B
VGLFVLIGIVLIGAGTVILGGQDLFKTPIILETVFDESVQGLEIGSAVKLRGVQLGSVSEIAFVRDAYPLQSAEALLEHGEKVVVLMEVMDPPEVEISPEDRRENVSQLIGRGLRLRLASAGVTGTVFVQADLMDPERHPLMEIPWEPEHLYIPSAPSTMATLTSAAERIFGRLEDLDVEKVVQDLDALLVSLRQAVDGLDVPALQRDLSATLAEARGLMRDVDGQVEPIAAGIEGTLDDAQEALSIAAEDSPLRYDLARTLEELAAAARSIRILADYLQQHPEALVSGKSGKGAQ